MRDNDLRTNYKEVEKIINTYKEEYKPSYQTDIQKRRGKFSSRDGDQNFFTVNSTQKSIFVDLHEYNKDTIHEFIYSGVKNDMRFKLIAPKYHSFIFNGKAVKEYEFDMDKNSEKKLDMNLQPDSSGKDSQYTREYHFKLKT